MTILTWTREQKIKISEWQRSVLQKVKESGNDTLIANAAYDAKLTCRIAQAPYKWGYTDWDFFLFIAGRGAGKLISRTESCLTYNRGWIEYGDLKVGDYVFTEHGTPTKVLALHPQSPDKELDYYRITFNDGQTIDCCGEHLWHTWTHQERKQYMRQDRLVNVREKPQNYPNDWAIYNDGGFIQTKTRTTTELLETLKIGTRKDNNHSIPLAKSCELPEQKLPVDPYIFGNWLANGSKSSSMIWCHMDDVEFLENYISQYYNVRIENTKGNTGRISVYGLITDLQKNNVIPDKYIPVNYEIGSIAQRVALLQGFMDGDGCFEKKNTCVLYNTNLNIINSFKRILGSLGIKYTYRNKIGKIKDIITGTVTEYKTCHQLTFAPLDINPFLNPRKATKYADWRNSKTSQLFRQRARIITNIEPIEPIDMLCITVDSPSSLYLIGEACIPTHNTHAGVQWILDVIKTTDQQEDIAVVSPDYNSIIKVLIEGPSGFLRNAPKWMNLEWRKTDSTLEIQTDKFKHYVRFYSSESPERIRGGSFTRAWLDEAAAFKSILSGGHTEEIDQILFALREGHSPQLMFTTTPKNFKWLRDMLKRAETDPRVIVTNGSSMDNASNLGQGFINNIANMDPKSTRYRQEVLGELIELEGSVAIDEDWIGVWDTLKAMPKIERVIIVVDPAFDEMSIRKNDPCGLMVAGLFWCEEISEWAFLILDLIVKHMSAPALEDLIHEMWDTKYGGMWQRYPDLLMLEKSASGEAVAQYLRKRGVPASYFYTKNISKAERLYKCTPLIQEKRLWVFGDLRDKYAPWVQRYVEKLLEYPNISPDEDGGRHDEEIDLTSMLLLTGQEQNWIDVPSLERQSFDPNYKDSNDDYEEEVYNPYAV